MQLAQDKALSLLAKYGIPICRSEIVTIEKLHTSKMKYPVVLKTAAPEVIHKSDIGAVMTGIANREQLTEAAKRISANVKAHYPKAQDFFLIQEEMKGRELIVEVFKDVSFRIAPMDRRDAIDMINDIKGSAILKGTRGEKPVNLDAVADIIMKVAKLSLENPSITELDLNPVMVNEHSAKAVDARIMGDFH
jgi:acetyl-CoA synthetase (ADP-forming)